jgi:hypothetical protein
MIIAIVIVSIWLALNLAIFIGLMLRPQISRDDQQWMATHPGMPLHRRAMR